MERPLGELPISLCMIVRDEEELLAQCLRSCLPYVSEMIVVDTGSVDGTAAIAARFGARLIEIEWIDDFAAVRNAALTHAAQPWLLVLDADETLEPLMMEHWHSLLKDETKMGYYVQLVSSVDSATIDELQDGAPQTAVVKDLVCRLFRNDPRIRFAGAIHEEAVSAIEKAFGAEAIGLAPIVMQHEGYREERLHKRGKRERNARIIEAALAEQPGDPMLRYARGTEFFTYGDWENAAAWLEPLAAELSQTSRYAFTSDVLLKLSHALRASGQLQDAEHWAEQGWRIFGFADFPDLYEAHAAALLEQDLLGEAIQAYERALAVGSAPVYYTSAPGAGTYRTLCSAGFAAERQYRWREAAAYYKEALHIRPGYSPAWERLLMIGALDERFRPIWTEAMESFLYNQRLSLECQQGQRQVQKQDADNSRESLFSIEGLLWLFADAGLDLAPETSSLAIEQLGDRAAFWHGLLLVQQGDAEAARYQWERYAQKLADERKRQQAEAYLAALQLRGDQAGTVEHAGAAQRVAAAAGLAPADFARTLLHVRAWPAWQALLAAAPAHEAAAAHTLPPLQWCALLGARASAPGSAYAAQLLRAAAPVPAAPALLAAGAVAAAAGDWPAAAERFAAARACGPRPWLARAAGSGARGCIRRCCPSGDPARIGVSRPWSCRPF
ncbi:glycosyltransferase family 2 protein [Paenibacillus gorillae]|uniref:glycosyltransferase family 2 protein n=1 Tax=Paenibacillus gorillae TaxID=1243662 RepID=UPI0004B66D8E|nr:glycosyltransferase family 2 protein [Paenibacillus gorillae]